MGERQRKVVRLTKGNKVTGVYNNAREAAECVGVSESLITRACRTGIRSACYWWRYAREGEFETKNEEA